MGRYVLSDPHTSFWIRREEVGLVCSPHTGFTVPCQFRPAIAEWAKGALMIEDRVHAARSVITAFLEEFTQTAEVQLVWPELASILKLQSNPGPGIRNLAGVRARGSNFFGTTHEKAIIDDMLATCLLMPDKPLDAWVGEPK